MSEERTITDHKAAFIRAQVRLLSAPVKQSLSWQELGPVLGDEEASLSDKTVEDVVAKVDGKIKSHNRLVFSLQSQRHVAEQLDALYWNDVITNNLQVDVDATWVSRNADLCEPDVLRTLPESYRDLFLQSDHAIEAGQREKYEVLRKNLVKLNEEREKQKHTLATYRHLEQLLRPFENASESVQPNLVTRDGELSKELERMRMLIARVTGKVDTVPHHDASTTEVQAISNKDKLAGVLGIV